MKKLILLLANILILLSFTFAQAPPFINYQAVIRNNQGEILSDQQIDLKVSVIQGEVTGDLVFTETHSITTSPSGIVSIAIGSVNTEDFQSINWSTSPYFLSVEVNETILGTTQILSVPYAFYANSAGNSFSGDYNDLLNKPEFQFYWGDKDNDGFGDKYNTVYATTSPEGYVTNSDDCDDDNPNTNPDAEEVIDGVDNDCDGLIDCDDPDIADSDLCNDADDDGFTADVDCDDNDPNTYPGAVEFCDGVDNDCDEEIDEDAADAPTWYLDADSDGFGDPENSITSCFPPEGYVENSTDCDDSDPNTFPGAAEVLDGVDNDCNGLIDDIPTIACETGADCPSGFYCYDGECVPECPPGTTACAGSCVDLSNDPNNCGSCNIICPPGQTCFNGECIEVPENCTDGVDNDNDGYVDCDDPDCDENANCNPLVPGNTCAVPIAIDPLSIPFSTSGNTSTFTDDYTTSSTGYGANGPEVVYAFTPSSSALFSVKLVADNTDFDSVLYIRTTCDNHSSCIGESDSGVDGGEEVQFVSIEGDTYYIFVDGYGTEDMGNYQLVIEEM